MNIVPAFSADGGGGKMAPKYGPGAAGISVEFPGATWTLVNSGWLKRSKKEWRSNATGVR